MKILEVNNAIGDSKMTTFIERGLLSVPNAFQSIENNGLSAFGLIFVCN